MDTYKHDQKQYMERMNQTALSKFDLLKPYLNPTIKKRYAHTVSPS